MFTPFLLGLREQASVQALGNKRHESVAWQVPWFGNGISELSRSCQP